VKSFNDLCSNLVRGNHPLSKYILNVIMEIQSYMHEGGYDSDLQDHVLTRLFSGLNLEMCQFLFYSRNSNILMKHLSTFNVTDIKASLWHMSVNITLIHKDNFIKCAKTIAYSNAPSSLMVFISNKGTTN